ncbi:hypothetical protein OSTOST_14255, partial [Ostertagia ostertagi]
MKLAYLSREKLKEKSVSMISYVREEKYPNVVELPYPKTHEKHLPTYVVNIWDKKARRSKQMDAFHYLYGVKWIKMGDDELLVATWANRLQTHISITICDYTSAICKL